MANLLGVAGTDVPIRDIKRLLSPFLVSNIIKISIMFAMSVNFLLYKQMIFFKYIIFIKF